MAAAKPKRSKESLARERQSDAKDWTAKERATYLRCQIDKHFSNGKNGKQPKGSAVFACARCKDAAPECLLCGYAPNCCKQAGKTPHHVVQAHCFGERTPKTKKMVSGVEVPIPPAERKVKRFDGCDEYSADRAPCVCLDGRGKSDTYRVAGKKPVYQGGPKTGLVMEHGKIHGFVDDYEDKAARKGMWTLKEAIELSIRSVLKVLDCPPACLRTQLLKYHVQDCGIPLDTKLRADSMGLSKDNRALGAHRIKPPKGKTPTGTAFGLTTSGKPSAQLDQTV